MTSRSLVIGAATLVAIPVAVLVVLRLSPETLEAAIPAPAPLEMRVTLRDTSHERPVNINLRWNQPATIAAPSWSGLVTEVLVVSGHLIEHGDPLLSIDDVARIALETPRPFHRAISRNDQGPDVVMLQQALARSGFVVEPTGTMDSATIAAVRGFAESIGVVGRVNAFEPGWAVWLPKESFQVGAVMVETGQLAPSPGVQLLIEVPRIEGLQIFDLDGDSIDASGTWELEFMGQIYEMRNGQLSPPALNALSDLVEPSESIITGQIRLVEPVVVIDVPATAIVSGRGEELCIFVAQDDTYVPVVVHLGTSRAARVEVLAGLDQRDVILVNPGEVLSDVTCP